jgi:hypothetical protein
LDCGHYRGGVFGGLGGEGMGKMVNKNDGGPAFPCNSPDGTETYKGISLRDYLAAKAISAVYADLNPSTLINNWDEILSARCYRIADAMLAERAK